SGPKRPSAPEPRAGAGKCPETSRGPARRNAAGPSEPLLHAMESRCVRGGPPGTSSASGASVSTPRERLPRSASPRPSRAGAKATGPSRRPRAPPLSSETRKGSPMTTHRLRLLSSGLLAGLTFAAPASGADAWEWTEKEERTLSKLQRAADVEGDGSVHLREGKYWKVELVGSTRFAAELALYMSLLESAV